MVMSLLLTLTLLRLAAAFVPKPLSSSSICFPLRARARARPRAAVIEMRDASMVVDVVVGDRVRIKPGVVLDGRDYGGLEGIVTYAWEKCEVRLRT